MFYGPVSCRAHSKPGETEELWMKRDTAGGHLKCVGFGDARRREPDRMTAAKFDPVMAKSSIVVTMCRGH
jgi:hypothetical protein